ncbi:MAG: HEAT repeat domain-containing protein [Cyclobacteriaceae bacterium]
MEKEKLESLLIEYIDGALSSTESAEVEKLLLEDNGAKQLHDELKQVMSIMDEAESLDLTPGHERMFEGNLKKEIASQQSKTIFFRPVIYRAAAGIALVLLGLAGGYWLNKTGQQERELAALRKEMEATKQTMMAMLGNDQSASQRMQGVSVALTISSPDSDVVIALEKTMMSDPNTNVRLAALEALSKFVQEASIRKILTESLSKQDDPMVQIALIQLLVNLKERGVVNDLEKIIENDKSIDAVKDEAYTGIIKLS